jgi:hypothetical protein
MSGHASGFAGQPLRGEKSDEFAAAAASHHFRGAARLRAGTLTN